MLNDANMPNRSNRALGETKPGLPATALSLGNDALKSAQEPKKVYYVQVQHDEIVDLIAVRD